VLEPVSDQPSKIRGNLDGNKLEIFSSSAVVSFLMYFINVVREMGLR
jgi:hypothetical protein